MQPAAPNTKSQQTPAIVSLTKVADYDPSRVLESVRACLEPFGGMGAFVQPGKRVLLKPNLLGAFPVERAVTTHPALVRAVILLAQEAGGRVLVGDSPAMSTLEQAIRASGLEDVLNETGAELLDFSSPYEYEVPDHIVSRRLTLTRVLREVDVFITLPKLKTHAQMTFTGALKNQYGVIPGALKSQWHFRLQQPEWLAGLLLDIHRVVRPSLAIMDGIVAMEGQGPSSGRPRFLGALLASRDVAALDTLACHLIALDPMRVPALVAARQHEVGATRLDQIHVAGADWRSLCLPDFEKLTQLTDVARLLPLPKPVLKWITRQWTAKPRIIEGACTLCGICEAGCPVTPSAIHPAGPEPKVSDDQCIACYCCHEFCPSKAIDLRQPWLARHLPFEAMANRVSRLLGWFTSRNSNS